MNIDIKQIIRAAEAGGKVLQKYFGQDLKIEEKSMASDFRTRADTESEEAVIELLTQDFPDYNIFAEEQGLTDKNSEWEFVIDPLDGSNNYMLGIPRYSVSIALMQGDELRAAVIHDSTLGRTYHALAGEGVHINGHQIKISQESDISRATFGYAHNYNAALEYFDEMRIKLHQKKVKRILANWSPCLDFCLLAEGKIEAYYNDGSEIYDFLAGKLLVKEAGAIVKEFSDGKGNGDRNDKFLVSNCAEVEKEILECL